MSYTPPSTSSISQWIKITKTYSDFSTAGLTNNISLYTLPAKGIIHSVQVVPTVAFSGGLISAYTISVGIVGNLVKYSAAVNSFTGFALAQPSAITGIESMSATTDIRIAAISVTGLLNVATAGSVDIYLLISQLP